MERWFHLEDNGTTAKTEVLSGLTTFLTAVYILFVNAAILSETGMPVNGVFVATALSGAVCTLFVAIYANLPLAVSPAMSVNSFFAYTLCLGLGYHWKEALAITFFAGILHVVIIVTPLRKHLIAAIPNHLGIAAGTGLGLMIASIAIRNTGLFGLSSPYSDAVTSSALLAPSVSRFYNFSKFVPLLAATIMLCLLALEQKNGERYAALPVSILLTTFLCFPIYLPRFQEIFSSSLSMWSDFAEVSFSFFGSPGIGSIFISPIVTTKTLLLILLLALTNILDSFGTITGLRHMDRATFLTREDTPSSTKTALPRIDRAMVANSFGGVLSSLFGSSTAAVYLESATGMSTGGRTGLSGIVIGLLFLLCIPISGILRSIPIEAVAPTMVYAGISMIIGVRDIKWDKIEEAFPAFLTIMLIPLSSSILDGICVGIISYILIAFVLGKRKDVKPTLYVISLAYIATKVLQFLL